MVEDRLLPSFSNAIRLSSTAQICSYTPNQRFFFLVTTLHPPLKFANSNGKKAAAKTTRNQQSYQSDRNQSPMQSTYPQNQNPHYGNFPNGPNCYTQQSPNFYLSQQNSNYYQNTQSSSSGHNLPLQQNYVDHHYASPSSQQRLVSHETSPNISRNLNSVFGDNNDLIEETEVDVTEIPDMYANTLVRRPNKIVKWFAEEQAELAFCWVECSRDNVKGTSQTENSFWSSVLRLFNGRSPQNPTRTVDPLKQSWKRINANCQSWKEIMAGLESRRQSGANDFDLLSKANELYMAEHKNVPFNLHNCYDILSREEKWSNIRQEHSASRFMPRRPMEESSPRSPDPHESTPFSTRAGGRPPGKFKGKKKAVTDYSSYYEQLHSQMVASDECNRLLAEAKEAKRTERAKEKQRRHEDLQTSRERDLDIRERELARLERLDDRKLMSVNLDTLNPMQRLLMEQELEACRKRRMG